MRQLERQAMIAEVVKEVKVTAQVARQYLEAEEWVVEDAVFDIRAERARGMIPSPGSSWPHQPSYSHA